MTQLSKYTLLLITLVVGCKPTSNRQQYFDFINDPNNKIIQRISIGDVTAQMKWMSTGQLNRLPDQGAKEDKIENYYYFDARFEKEKGEKPGKEKSLYLNFDMQQDFVLWNGVDSLMPIICQKIENGKPGCYEYLLAFERKNLQKTDDLTIFYHDKILGIGTVAFVYDRKDIARIPKLMGE